MLAPLQPSGTHRRFFLALAACLLPSGLLLPRQADAQAPTPSLVVTHSLNQAASSSGASSLAEGMTPNFLTLGQDGLLYGTAAHGGSSEDGTLFRVNLDGSAFTVLTGFAYGSGGNPISVARATDGTLYGTASGYYTNSGAVYRYAATDTQPVLLHVFGDSSPNIDGLNPAPGLIIGTDGYLYGATVSGGLNQSGTLFRVSMDGTTFSTLHTFSALNQTANPQTNADGDGPSALTVGADGAFYGTTALGGANGGGTVFKVNSDGTGFTTLVSLPAGIVSMALTGTPAAPNSALTLGRDGLFYGTSRLVS